jgi:hypothetical protein
LVFVVFNDVNNNELRRSRGGAESVEEGRGGGVHPKIVLCDLSIATYMSIYMIQRMYICILSVFITLKLTFNASVSYKAKVTSESPTLCPPCLS